MNMKQNKKNKTRKINRIESDGLDLIPEKEIEFKVVLQKLLDKKLYILTFLVVSLLMGVIYAKSLPNIYRAEALLQVESKDGGLPGLSDLQGFLVDSSETVTEIEIMKSRMILGEVVKRMGLTIEVKPKVFPFYEGVYQSKGGELSRPLIEGYAWGGEVLKVSQFEVPKKLEDQSFTVISLGGSAYALHLGSSEILKGRVGELVEHNSIKIFVQELKASPLTPFSLVKVNELRKINLIAGSLTVSEKRKSSGVITVGFNSADPAYAEELVKIVTETYVRKNINRNSAEASSSLSFLEGRLPEIEDKLLAAEERLNDFQVSARSVNILSETDSLLNQMVSLEEQISKLQLEEIDIQRRFKPTHPTYKAFVSQMTELNKRKEGFQGQIRDLPKTQQELLRLKRDVEVNTQIYTQILNSIQELNILRAGTVGNVRLVDAARVNSYQPVKPRRTLIIILSGLFGLVFSMIIVLVRASINRGVENPADIESIGLDVLAAIPFSEYQTKLGGKLSFGNRNKSEGHKSLLAVENPSDISVESIRSIRTAIQLSSLDAENNRIMITGPSPSVGKTFTSSNLAVTLAEAGKRVIVVDGDLRKGTLNSYFGIERGLGLSEYLQGKLDYKGVVHSTDIDNLDLIVSGGFPSNPSELLSSSRFEGLLCQLSENYDLVIVDSPPIMAVTDAIIIGQYTATNLMVCRYGLNSIKEVELSARRLFRSNIEINGVVFNGILRSSVGYGYEYYAYEYGRTSDNG